MHDAVTFRPLRTSRNPFWLRDASGYTWLECDRKRGVGDGVMLIPELFFLFMQMRNDVLL